MPITYRWYNDDNDIILIEIQGRWTWNEMFRVRDEVVDLVDDEADNDTIIDIIADMSNADGMPGNPMAAMTQGPKMMEKIHPQQGTMYYADIPASLQNMLNMAKTMLPHVIANAEFAVVKSVDAALVQIQTKRNSNT